MQPALQRRDGDRRVQEGGHGDADDVQRLVLEQLLPLVDVALDAVALGQLGAHGLLQPGDPGELDAG